MSKSFTDVYTYIIILFIVAAFMWGILSLGGILTQRAADGDINMTNNTLTYINKLNNNPSYNLSHYQSDEDMQETGVVYKVNSSEGTPKDFSIEYFEAKERASGYENILKRIYYIPNTMLLLVFGEINIAFKGVISAFFWFLSFAIALSLYWMFRGVKGG